MEKVSFLKRVDSGILLMIGGKEHLLEYSNFPWFKSASDSDLSNITVSDGGIRFPTLDVDLTIDSIKNPSKYPLVYK